MISFRGVSDRVKKFANTMKRKIRVLFIASKRYDISIISKFVIIFVVAYALSPIDLIPDFIPILGYLDDVILLPLGIALAIHLIPDDVIAKCEEIAAKEDEIVMTKSKFSALVIIAMWLILLIALFNVVVRFFS